MPDFKAQPENSPFVDRTAAYQNAVRWMWRIFYGIGIFLAVSILVFSFTTPSFKRLEDPSFNVASEVIANDMKTVLGRYYYENRSPVSYTELSPWLVKALVATEDSRFYSHSGVDGEALGRVALRSFLLRQHGSGGGSTISMQLAKLLYSDRNLTNMNLLERVLGLYYRKLSEMITAVKLERSYTKEEIMAMYLNKYDFNYGGHGIRSASEVYFGKSPDSLKIEESATLIGMLQNSSYFNPLRRPQKCLNRRNEVFLKMQRNGYLSQSQYEALKLKPLDMSHFKTKTHTDGLATYFRTELEKDVRQILNNTTVRKSDGTKYDIYRDGLKIYTTIDPETQKLAEEAMREHMAQLQAKYWRVWAGKDPWTYKTADTDPDEIKQRLAQLETDIRSSDRFQNMRAKFLDDALGAVQENFEGLKLEDSDIIRMLRQETQPGLFETLLSTGSLTRAQIDILRKIMATDEWLKLKAQWSRLQTAVKTDFYRPVQMKVFAYNERGEKDTTMTPLDSIRYHRMHMQLGSLAVDPTDGTVKAWVGGIGYKYFQYDHVRSDRQVGSTIKPFVYSTAINQLGISPCMSIDDVPQTISVGEGNFQLSSSWTPHNSDGYSGQYLQLWDALKKSKNTASVYLMKQIGTTQPVRELMNSMGIDSAAKYRNGQYRVPKQPSICLGAVDLKVIEMAGAYTTFADNGVYHKPVYLNRIVDKAGHVIFQAIPEYRRALPEGANYVMLAMLEYVAKGMPGLTTLKSQVAGKTGTTNNFKDGWFMGVTPRLIVATWVGGDDNWIRFTNINDGQGSAMARPFYARFMQKLENDPRASYDYAAKFKVPDNIGIELDCSKYHGVGEGGVPQPNTPNEFDSNRFQDETPPATNNPPASSGGPNLIPAPGAGARPANGAIKTPTPFSTGSSKPAGVKPKPAVKPKAVDDGFSG